MSPELVKEISWFLTECAKLRETILITGNHDCNLNNQHRLDVLTPIIDNLKNPRIHYLRDTEACIIYIILLLLCIPSWITKRIGTKGELVEGENTICLFHGACK